MFKFRRLNLMLLHELYIKNALKYTILDNEYKFNDFICFRKPT